MNTDVLYLLEMYAKLFAASSPIAAMAMFIAMTPGYTPKERWQTSLKATNISLGILLACAFFGESLLDFMGINMNAFRIAGGTIMALIGLDMIRSQISAEAAENTSKSNRPDITVTPLAFPVISGPGAISSLMIGKSDAINTLQNFYAYVALILLMLTFYGGFYVTAFSSKWLTKSVVQISTKLFGLIILALGVQFLAGGIIGFSH